MSSNRGCPGDWLRWAAPFAAPPKSDDRVSQHHGAGQEFVLPASRPYSPEAPGEALRLLLRRSDSYRHRQGHADLPEGTLCLGNCTIQPREHLCSRPPAGQPDSTGDRGRLNPPEFRTARRAAWPPARPSRLHCRTARRRPGRTGDGPTGIAGKPGVFLIFNPVSAVPVLPAQFLMESSPSYAVPRIETVRPALADCGEQARC